MAGSVARLPGSPAGGDVPPADLYRIAVEEYRFQAQYNWSRTQYLLGFNVAILIGGTAVAAQLGGEQAALVFCLGVVGAALSAGVVRTQHGYYRAARDHLGRVEERLHIPADQRLDTTSTLGHRPRFASVNQIVYALLAAMAAADLIGAFLSLTD